MSKDVPFWVFQKINLIGEIFFSSIEFAMCSQMYNGMVLYSLTSIPLSNGPLDSSVEPFVCAALSTPLAVWGI